MATLARVVDPATGDVYSADELTVSTEVDADGTWTVYRIPDGAVVLRVQSITSEAFDATLAAARTARDAAFSRNPMTGEPL